MTWIDTHIHVSDIAPNGQHRTTMREDLLDVLQRADADLRYVISPDSPYIGNMAADPDSMMQANCMIHELVKAAPQQLYGSCMINPAFPDEACRVIDKCFDEWDFVQLGEMLPYCHDYSMAAEKTVRVVQHAVEHNVPVQVHLATYWQKDAGASCDGMNQLADLLRCCERVPQAKIILAHAIGCGPTPDFVPWADMFLDTIDGLFGSWPDTFWIEIRDFQCPALARTLDDVPGNRILAGTDWTTRVGPPFQAYGTMFGVQEEQNPFPAQISSFTKFLQEAGASDDTIERIAWRNAVELYNLPS